MRQLKERILDLLVGAVGVAVIGAVGLGLYGLYDLFGVWPLWAVSGLLLLTVIGHGWREAWREGRQ